MRNLRNFLWFIVGIGVSAIALLGPQFAHAQTVTVVTKYSVDQVPGLYNTASAACTAAGLAFKGKSVDGSGGGYIYDGNSAIRANGLCGIYASLPGGASEDANGLQIYTTLGCSDDSPLVEGQCVPPSPPPVNCSKGGPTSWRQDMGPQSSTTPPITKDAAGCTLVGVPTYSQCSPASQPVTADTHIYCNMSGVRDPSKAPLPATVEPPPLDPANGPASVKTQGDSNGNCPKGTSLVGYDSSGTPMCVGMGTDPGKAPAKVDTTPTQTTSNPDGSTITKDTTASTNSDGSQTTRTATCTIATNGGKSCITTTATGNTPTGVQGKNDTDPKTGDDTKGDNPAGLDGDLYGKGTKTMQDVMNHWTSAVSGAPFITAAQGFLAANVNGGACPSWRADVAYFKMSINLGQYFCAPGTETIFGYIGIGVMLGAAFLAFKIAFL